MCRRLPWVLLAVVAVTGCGPAHPPATAGGAGGSPAPTTAVAHNRDTGPTASPAARNPTSPAWTPAPPAGTCGSPGTSGRPPAVDRGPEGTFTSTGSAAVALTFDDGPDPVNTPRLLDVLGRCGAKATFCVEGAKAARYPDIVRRIHDEGHALCNHTWRHIRQLGTYGRPRIRQDLTDTLNAIHAVVPDAKVSYFRAPGGAWTADYVAVAAELGMTSIHWDVDPSDWQGEVYGHGSSMVNHIVAVVRNETRPGSIILSHDHQKPDTTAAYQVLLPWLTSQFTLIALPPAGLGRCQQCPATSMYA